MIVAIHQPNLFPWLGFFDKMASADAFILLDNVQFTRRGYQNRVQIKGPQGMQWLTVPVKSKGQYQQLTCQIEINGEHEWKEKHLKTIERLYRNTPAFEELFPAVQELYRPAHQKLIELTIPGIEWIKTKLEIRTPIYLASDFQAEGASSELLSELVRAVGGTCYLSGPSGKEYLEGEVFAQRGIAVRYQYFQEEPYPQRFGPFVGGASALDYLFNDPLLFHWKNGRANLQNLTLEKRMCKP
ncbi:WbqC family protein [Brevibacillus ruminantium]|uniref:WbqC family protein n=1 Tax=Brevibacillus ruminantium TaxID=2950604 RepID=A0ABY4WK49_9BACL|nr:WbqC family protein [Brevibacillus ruminantium]USG67141.1 WbqC family protein [Brevibacillus ruminantium]